MPLAQDPDKQRHDFFRDLAQMPLPQVQAMLDSVNFITPAERSAIERRRDDLLTKRRMSVMQRVDQDLASLNDRATRAQEEADAIAAEYEQLVADTEAGKVELDDFTRTYERLEHRLNKVRRNLASFERAADAIREKEEDPEAWLQSLERRFPQIRQGVLGHVHGGVAPSGEREWTTHEE